jgi:hypothetical protein
MRSVPMLPRGVHPNSGHVMSATVPVLLVSSARRGDLFEYT